MTEIVLYAGLLRERCDVVRHMVSRLSSQTVCHKSQEPQKLAYAVTGFLRQYCGLWYSQVRLNDISTHHGAPGNASCSPAGKQLQKVADLISEGKVKVIVDKTFPLKDAAYVTSAWGAPANIH